jgi:hypothetical protein
MPPATASAPRSRAEALALSDAENLALRDWGRAAVEVHAVCVAHHRAQVPRD